MIFSSKTEDDGAADVTQQSDSLKKLGKRKVPTRPRGMAASPTRASQLSSDSEVKSNNDVESVGSVGAKQRYAMNMNSVDDGIESDYSVLRGSVAVTVGGEAFDRHFQANYDKLYASSQDEGTGRQRSVTPTKAGNGTSKHDDDSETDGEKADVHKGMMLQDDDGGEDGHYGDDEQPNGSITPVKCVTKQFENLALNGGANGKTTLLKQDMELDKDRESWRPTSRLGRRTPGRFSPAWAKMESPGVMIDPILSESPMEKEDVNNSLINSMQVEHGTPNGSTLPWQRDWPACVEEQDEATSQTTSEDGGCTASSASSQPSTAHCAQSGLREAASQVTPSAPPLGLTKATNGSPFGRRTLHQRTQTWSHNSPSHTNAGNATPARAETEHQRLFCKSPSANSFHSGTPSTPIVPFHLVSLARGQEAWQAMIAYDACLRVCLNASSAGCLEAHNFLHDGCYLLRTCFGLHQVLLQPGQGSKAEKEDKGVTSSPAAKVGTLRAQIRKVQISKWLSPSPTKPSPTKSNLSPGGANVGTKTSPVPPVRPKKWMKKVRSFGSTGSMNDGVYCMLRMKSADEDSMQRSNPGIGEVVCLHPENANDELILEIHDSKGLRGRASINVGGIEEEHKEKMRVVGFYHDSDATECVGKIQLLVSYVRNGPSAAWNHVGETLAYDIVLDVALRVLNFDSHNLHLQGPWRWLLSEFAQTYSVSQFYTNLRYLAHIMFVSTPTEDCMCLIRDLLTPVVKAKKDDALSRQEKRLLVDVEEQVAQLLALAFRNYKCLDETSCTGIAETVVLQPVSRTAPCLYPAVEIFTLVNDIALAEPQNLLRSFFQRAAKRRCSQYVQEAEKEGNLEVGEDRLSAAYARMCTLCTQLTAEVEADISIHETDVFPSCVDLPRLTGEIYNRDMAVTLREFLRSHPPPGPGTAPISLLHASADFEEKMREWGIRSTVLGAGVAAKELFGSFLDAWMQDTRAQLLEESKFDKLRFPGVSPPTETSATSPFVEEMFVKIREVLMQYESVMMRWPEYVAAFEGVLCDVEKGIISCLDKQFSEFLLPLKEPLPGSHGNNVLNKIATAIKGCNNQPKYIVPVQLGLYLNTIKRLLEVLRPRVEQQMRRWMPEVPPNVLNNDLGASFGDRLSELTLELRAKYKTVLVAIIERLLENMRQSKSTNVRKILAELKQNKGEEDVRRRLSTFEQGVADTIGQLDRTTYGRVFVAICRGFWDLLGKEILHFLENRKENISWFKSSAAETALQTLDNVFLLNMQKLQGHVLQEKDLEAPRSIQEARAMLSKDGPNGVGDSLSIY